MPYTHENLGCSNSDTQTTKARSQPRYTNEKNRLKIIDMYFRRNPAQRLTNQTRMTLKKCWFSHLYFGMYEVKDMKSTLSELNKKF